MLNLLRAALGIVRALLTSRHSWEALGLGLVLYAWYIQWHDVDVYDKRGESLRQEILIQNATFDSDINWFDNTLESEVTRSVTAPQEGESSSYIRSWPNVQVRIDWVKRFQSHYESVARLIAIMDRFAPPRLSSVDSLLKKSHLALNGISAPLVSHWAGPKITAPDPSRFTVFDAMQADDALSALHAIVWEQAAPVFADYQTQRDRWTKRQRDVFFLGSGLLVVCKMLEGRFWRRSGSR